MSEEVNLNPEEILQEQEEAADSIAEEKKDTDEKTAFGKKKLNAEISRLKVLLDEKEAMYEDMKNRALRTAAEFDNYKKRTAREMESIFTDAKCDAIKNILPVVDNFERALGASVCDSCNQYKEGVNLIYKQLMEVLSSLGVEEIKALGEPFNPELHNAVMHIDDDNKAESEIVEVFQKGYKIENKVLRYCMVKVAN